MTQERPEQIVIRTDRDLSRTGRKDWNKKRPEQVEIRTHESGKIRTGRNQNL